MSDTIIVRCYNCGKEIGRISFIPGHQKVGCPDCGKTTDVLIKKDGSVETY